MRRSSLRSTGLFLAFFSLIFAGATLLPRALAEEPYSPKIAAASNEGETAIARIRVPEGFRVQLVAAEPQLANPVAFCIDEKGRIFVAETFRQQKGVEDNRNHMSWLDDDLAAMTVEDRLAYFKKHLGDKVDDYAKEHDRIRLLEDKDGDGKIDSSIVFADGFNSIVEGTGAGLLARGGNLWYTNIPNLWLLRDENGDGKADSRKSLHYGYGVRVAFRGHDSHGLRFGPDGKLYFSIGDRGFNVKTPEGTQLVSPDRGAVLRCNPDGSELEVVHTGLRNPQELAFDDYGNLFTGENNSDSGDRARWVQIVEGGDSGWRMNYQYLRDRGPWNREKLWHPQHEGQPAYIVPPIANFADGPSGLTYYPGLGMPERYNGHFFLCDFRGGHANSGIRSFGLKPKGASFEMTDAHEFAWSVLVTDADFGPDGALYLTDWVEGWDGPGKGRIYKIAHKDSESSPAVAEVRKLIAEGFAQRTNEQLAKLLAHPHREVRQEAQFALAAKWPDSTATLEKIAAKHDNQFARIHALWALGQVGRKNKAAVAPLLKLLADPDAEIRAQSAKILGECEESQAAGVFATLLKDESPRVRYFTALGMGKMGREASHGAVLEMLRENADRDPYLRHAGVMALANSPFRKDLLAAANDPSPAVRIAVLLALRRQASVEVARFLNDTEPRIVDEAARAINDVPIADAFPQLAALAGRSGLSESTLWRVINANFRLGTTENAAAVARLATRGDVPEALRVEALKALGDWAKPSGRDRVLGSWRPLPERDSQIAANAFRSALGGIFSGGNKLRQEGTKVAVQLGIKEVGPALLELVADTKSPPQTRVDALQALLRLKDDRTEKATEIALADMEPRVRAEGRRALAKQKPDVALPLLKGVLAGGSLVERQVAFATLGEMAGPAVDELLAKSLDDLIAGRLAPEVQLELIEAAGKRFSDSVKERLPRYEATLSGADPLAPYRVAQAGGDAERGRRTFFEKSETYCVRCHKVGGTGGDVGPDLSKIGGQQKRDYLLEAIVLPDKQIAKGFDPVVIVTEAGKVHSGIIKSDDGKTVQLMNAEGQLISIPKSEIDEQARGKSSMPEDLIKKLTKSELRDLVEFLSQLK